MASASRGDIYVSIRGSARQFAKEMKQAKGPVRRLGKAVKGIGRSINRMVRVSLTPLRLLRKAFQKVWTSARGVMRIMGGPLGRLGWFGGMGAAGTAIMGGVWSLKAAAEYEEAEVAFEVMLGSAKRAKRLLDQLTSYSARTPFQLPDLLLATKQLMAFGFAADQILPNLRVLGDISMGLTIPIKELAWLYGQTKVEQRLYARDLRQFTTRGIPLIGELAKQFGIAQHEVRGLIEEGKIGFPHVQKALINLTGKTGRFYKMTERGSQMLRGLWSTLKDNIWLLLKDVGTALADKMGLKDVMRGLIGNLTTGRGAIVRMIMAIVDPLLTLGRVVLPLIRKGFDLLVRGMQHAARWGADFFKDISTQIRDARTEIMTEVGGIMYWLGMIDEAELAARADIIHKMMGKGGDANYLRTWADDLGEAAGTFSTQLGEIDKAIENLRKTLAKMSGLRLPFPFTAGAIGAMAQGLIGQAMFTFGDKMPKGVTDFMKKVREFLIPRIPKPKIDPWADMGKGKGGGGAIKLAAPWVEYGSAEGARMAMRAGGAFASGKGVIGELKQSGQTLKQIKQILQNQKPPKPVTIP